MCYLFVESHIKPAEPLPIYSVTFAVSLPAQRKASVRAADLHVFTASSVISDASAVRTSVYYVRANRTKHSLVDKHIARLTSDSWQKFDVTSALKDVARRSSFSITFELTFDAGVNPFFAAEELTKNFRAKLEVCARLKHAGITQPNNSHASKAKAPRIASHVDDVRHAVNDVSANAVHVHEKCGLHSVSVLFEKLGFENVKGLDGRLAFNFTFCQGSCADGSHHVQTNHAKYKTLLSPEVGVPGLCCTATKFDSVTMLRFNSHTGRYDTLQLTEMVATQCECM